jgi:hypothetical protein
MFLASFFRGVVELVPVSRGLQFIRVIDEAPSIIDKLRIQAKVVVWTLSFNFEPNISSKYGWHTPGSSEML